ncbi:hypothetical protein ACFQ0G_13090 [Streptomyces chiangmaiensis]
MPPLTCADEVFGKGNVSVEATLPVVRGRIRHADQLRRHFGRAFPVEASYEEFTEDIPENRILLTAARRLLALPGVPTACRSELRRVIAALPDVGDVPSTRALPDWTADPHNARLQTAIRLGELVLRGASYELDGGGTVPVDGLLINMEKVFEDFVAVSLRDQHTRTWEACRQGSLLEFRSGSTTNLPCDISIGVVSAPTSSLAPAPNSACPSPHPSNTRARTIPGRSTWPFPRSHPT